MTRSTTPSTSRRTPRPPDPDRRNVILEATLDVVAERGTAGTTMRRVAERADVPLGSMTYYFEGKQPLLIEAFTLLAERFSRAFREQLSAATTADEARDAVTDIICGPFGDAGTQVLNFELYSFASCDEAVRTVVRGWMAESRAALQLHFDAVTARGIDALIEGLMIHNSFDENPATREQIAELVGRLTASAAPAVAK